METKSLRHSWNVREQARSEVYAWLDGDEEGPEPKPPEGMHPMSLREWNLGAAEAREEYETEEAQWVVVENFIVWLLKTGLILSGVAALYYLRMPWVSVIGGLVLLYYTLRIWK